MLVLSYYRNLFIPLKEREGRGGGVVAGLWILLAMGVVPSHRGWVPGQPTIGLFWAPDLHLQRMLLNTG